MRALAAIGPAVMVLGAVLFAQSPAATVAAQPPALQTGKWKATFTAPKAQQPKTFGSVLFDFKVEGRVITGTATMGDWPGVCAISDGRIDLDGRHFSFVTTGELWSSSGYPRYTFDGTVKDGVMSVTLTFGYVGNPAPGRTLPMEGRPVSASGSVAGAWTVVGPDGRFFPLTLAQIGRQRDPH